MLRAISRRRSFIGSSSALFTACFFSWSSRSENSSYPLATLVPVILALAFVIKVAAPLVDETQSARPLAEQLAAYPKAPIAVLDLHRGIEYGLGFYRNQQMEPYRPGAGRRLLIAPMDSVSVPREKIFVGEYGPTRLGIWWVER